MLDDIPFGKHYFEVGIILRDSLLVSSVLFNSEAWYNLTESELDLLETVDLLFLRKLLKAPKGTPKEMLFLELGCLPLREIIRGRRLNFLHYILNEDPKSMIYRVLQSQLKSRTKKDWVTTVIEDMKKLELNVKMEEIRKTKKTSWKQVIKEKIKNYTFDKLEKRKLSHSKVENVEHCGINMQKYLKPNKTKISKEDSQLIFKLRCRVTKAKENLKGIYDNLECSACGKEEESQKHIVLCEELNKEQNNKKVNYDKIFNGTVTEKLIIAKIFKENFDILENMKK